MLSTRYSNGLIIVEMACQSYDAGIFSKYDVTLKFSVGTSSHLFSFAKF